MLGNLVVALSCLLISLFEQILDTPNPLTCLQGSQTLLQLGQFGLPKNIGGQKEWLMVKGGMNRMKTKQVMPSLELSGIIMYD